MCQGFLDFLLYVHGLFVRRLKPAPAFLFAPSFVAAGFSLRAFHFPNSS
jgi:hypothetical protein